LVEGLDALIIALAPVFAAGFAVQKLMEILDAFFSRLAWSGAKILEKYSGEIIDAEEEANVKTEAENVKAGTKGYAKEPATVENTKEGGKKKVKADKMNGKASRDKNAQEPETVKKAKEEFEKSLKVLVTGIFSIGFAYVIVWQVPNFHVLTPLFNINATTGTVAATATVNIDQNMDKWITILFIAAGTEGINSILKYLGYAKEKKQDAAEGKSGE